MSTRLFGLVLATILLATVHSAHAQQPGKVPRIGFVSGTGDTNNPGPSTEAFRRGLRDLGHIEGKNIVVEYRYAEGKSERYPSLVAELVQLKVDVVVITAFPAIRAAKQAIKTIPIVMAQSSDPVALGFVASLARPGGNITGITSISQQLVGKRLELLKEIVPQLPQIGMLWNPENPFSESSLKEMQDTARALAVKPQMLEVARWE